MELNINRLKVLGQQELEELDKEIEKYKGMKSPLFDETLDELRKKLKDSQEFLSSTQSEHRSKENEINTKKSELENKNQQYSRLVKQISDFETQNASLEKECAEILSKIDESNEQINKLSKVKHELELKLQSMTAHFESVQSKNDEVLKTIRQEIHEYTCKIKQTKQTHFEMYNKFVEDMNAAVEIDTGISEYEKLFATKKEVFMSVLCRNMEKYNTMRQFLIEKIHTPYNDPTGCFHNIHRKICVTPECPRGDHYFENQISNIRYNNGQLCEWRNYGYGPQIELDQYMKQIGQWLVRVCYPKMKDYITDPELSYLTQKLKYEELFNLFTNSNLFDEDMKTFSVFEFLCFISFIGSNGNCSLLEICK